MDCLINKGNILKKNILWVASYPRSGNTWIRFLIANLLCGPITQSQQMIQIVPDIHEPLSKNYFAYNGVCFLKTHWRFQMISSGPYHNVGAIYIYRNPLDIIASHIHYFRITNDISKINLFVDLFIESYGVPRWLNFQIGSWTENIDGWIFQKKDFPCLILKYEDIKLNTYDAVNKICKLLDIKKNDSEIHRAIQQSTFKNLQSLEEQEIKTKLSGLFLTDYLGKKDVKYRFMNKGEIGNYRELLSSDQIKKIIDRFGDMIEKLGYASEYEYYIR